MLVVITPDETEGCSISLTEKSLALIEESHSVADWWPLLPEDSDPQHPVKHAGLFVQRQGRKRKVGDTKAKDTKTLNIKAASNRVKAKLKKAKQQKKTVMKMRRAQILGRQRM